MRKGFNRTSGIGISLGLLSGVITGIAQDNTGLWLSLGLTRGVATDYTMKEESSSNKDNKNSKS